jgi:hypothetical protein
MKTYFSFLLFFTFLLAFCQKKDTLREIKSPDCNEFYKNEKKVYDSLLIDYKNVDFSTLYSKIIEKIKRNNLKTENLILYINMRRGILGCDINDSQCSSNLNIENPFYNEDIFWNDKSILKINKKIKKNLIFVDNFDKTYSSETFINKKNHRYITKDLQKFIINQHEGIYKEINFYYLPINDKSKINI